MKANQLRNQSAIGVLCLTLGTGCRKDAVPSTPVSCRCGTCCGPVGIHYKYVETYENELVKLGGSSDNWGVEFSKSIPTVLIDTRGITTAKVCDLSIEKAVKFKLNNPADTANVILVWIWGRLYIGDEIPTLTVGAPRFFAIDRIEVAK